MKIKHWSGYGTMDVKKDALGSFKDGRLLAVTLRGNHECGLWNRYRDEDGYLIWKMFIKRWDWKYKEKQPRFIKTASSEFDYVTNSHGLDEEVCHLTFVYWD